MHALVREWLYQIKKGEGIRGKQGEDAKEIEHEKEEKGCGERLSTREITRSTQKRAIFPIENHSASTQNEDEESCKHQDEDEENKDEGQRFLSLLKIQRFRQEPKEREEIKKRGEEAAGI